MDKEEFMRQWAVPGMPADKIKLANAAWEAATLAEREACARLCEDNCAGYSYGRDSQGPCLTEFPKEGGGRHDGMTYAAAIRMRSNSPLNRLAEGQSEFK